MLLQESSGDGLLYVRLSSLESAQELLGLEAGDYRQGGPGVGFSCFFPTSFGKDYLS